MNTNAIIVAVIVAPLPMLGSDPKVADFITRHSNRLWIIGAACVFGMIGMTASIIHLVPTKVGLYFWSPLWQVLVVQTLYFFWYRFYKRPPVRTAFNWHSNLTADRFLAIGIGLLGALIPILIIG